MQSHVPKFYFCLLHKIKCIFWNVRFAYFEKWDKEQTNTCQILVNLHLITVVGHIFLVLPWKSAFVEDFSDILTNNKFNKKFGAITPTPYLNSLIPNYLITLINTL